MMLDTSIEVLRISMDGRWSCVDLADACLHLEDLYNLQMVLASLYEEQREISDPRRFQDLRYSLRRLPAQLLWQALLPPPIESMADSSSLRRMVPLLTQHGPLELRRVRYGSPGFTDAAGVGVIVRQVKDFLLRTMEFCAPSSVERRKLQNEDLRLKNEERRIKNARQAVELAKRLGYSPSEVRRLVGWVDDRQETFIRLIDEGKMLEARVLERNQTEQN